MGWLRKVLGWSVGWVAVNADVSWLCNHTFIFLVTGLRVIVDKQVLMSSHRDYETENDWEWLRNDSDYADALRFEQVPDEPEKYEMVVTDEWQSKVSLTMTDLWSLQDAPTDEIDQIESGGWIVRYWGFVHSASRKEGSLEVRWKRRRCDCSRTSTVWRHSQLALGSCPASII